jgi:N-ethylmaleimide reductase
MSFPNLVKPIKLGSVEIPNRFVMAPLTRIRASMPGHVPNALMAEMYSQRATTGLIIAEATMIGPATSAFRSEPGCWNDEQVQGWKITTEAVHNNGGKIFLQIVHAGRAAHTSNNDGAQSVSSSAKAPNSGHQVTAEFNASGEKTPYELPRALETAEIPTIVAQFTTSAKLAIEAGFDGV